MGELLKVIQQHVGFGYESSMPYITILRFQFPTHSSILKFRFSFFPLSYLSESELVTRVIYLGQLIVTRFAYTSWA